MYHGRTTAGRGNVWIRRAAESDAARDDDLAAGSTELYAIYVDPEALGTGVGAGLMARQLEALGPAGAGQRCLWVFADNERAIRFYERWGWAADGRRRTLTIGGAEIDEVRYRFRRPAKPGGSPIEPTIR
ncbi:MAG TPA: GNAT family N-acetyltransferase [Candidatus Limnocylindrales bacterium]|jgi:GNAT superfamily N-acetyltransferase|nr:GNAT family N-acetyltransferase [Candidatus Limnocylindrales bacterium]